MEKNNWIFLTRDEVLDAIAIDFQQYGPSPWLELKPQEHCFSCLIQDIKPEVCQQYPFTRKHAVMTGCRGEFQKALA